MKKNSVSYIILLLVAAISVLSSCATQRAGCPGKITSAPVAAPANG
jgi:hypothetical protein